MSSPVTAATTLRFTISTKINGDDGEEEKNIEIEITRKKNGVDKNYK